MTEKEYRKKLKEAHVCRECKKQDAYTLAGRTYCFECAEKARLRRQAARKDPAKNEKMLQQKREQRARYKAENKCLRCGKQLYNGERLCGICREKEKREVRKSRGNTPRLYGITCWLCNKEPCMEDSKLCKACYEKMAEVGRENLKNVNREKHPWRNLQIKSNRNNA